MNETTTQNPYLLPGAIIIAGILIAGAVYYVDQKDGGTKTTVDTTPVELTIPPVTAEDHIIGNPNADVVLVEYSDLECPFCKEFHKTMTVISDEFGKNGQLAWVYRNFPIPTLHPNAPKIAEAAECVAELGGNDAYWAFLTQLFKDAPAGTFVDLTKLPGYATDLGINEADFTACYNSGKYAQKIQNEANDAIIAGQAIPDGIGTPFSILLVKGRAAVPIVGAQPLAAVRSVIQAALADQSEKGTQGVPVLQ